MTTIRQDDFITSVTDALQYISYYHTPDFIRALHDAYAAEQSAPARDAMAQILINSRMCAEGHRPICQDTGMVVVFLKIGMDVRWDADLSVAEMVNAGVRAAYGFPENLLRASVVEDPVGIRRNTGDNSPATIHMEVVPGDTVEVTVAAKGGGSENKAKFAMLNPSDDIAEFVLEAVRTMGAGWCPPGVLGIGVGGGAEKAMLLAKESLMEPIDMHALKARSPETALERLRVDLFDRLNALGIGAQGLGGLTTVLDVKIKDYPTHAASKPVAIIPNCAATRHLHFTLDGTGPARLIPPSLDLWPDVHLAAPEAVRRVDLSRVTRQETATWSAGDRLLLTGKILTGRDAAHKRLADMFASGAPLPGGLDFRGRFIYYVGPVDPVGDEVVGPAGPTTSTRMDKFTDMMLEETGLIGMIGKAERGPAAIDAIARHGAVYTIAVGGAAYLVSQAIKSARVVAFEDLGMEAIYEFEVEDMPVMVGVDASGQSIHTVGPARWRRHPA